MMRLVAVLLCLLSAPAFAHELRPAFLELKETEPDVFAVMWKVPARGDMRLSLHARLPDECVADGKPEKRIGDGAYVERWRVHCAGGLKGRVIGVEGLAATLTDSLVHITHAGGITETARLTGADAAFTVAGPQAAWQTAATYFRLGVEHILAGFDHLLFVLALMLLIRDGAALVKTVTAFTLAHSLTLSGAGLGWFSLPQKPVEAVIALSIAFVARELIARDAGRQGLAQAAPWVVAFIFGLLHGLGFAGALAEIGLPQADVPLALLAFNLGVEAGQLAFIGAVAVAYLALKRLAGGGLVWMRQGVAYGIGGMAVFWLLERVI